MSSGARSEMRLFTMRPQRPAPYGDAVAFVAEVIISFALMSSILSVSERENLPRYTPYFGAALVAALYSVRIATIGRQCKPGTHVRAGHFRQLLAAVWIYFTAPPFGMLATAEVFLILRGGVGPFCAKLDHASRKRCMFHHEYRTVFTLFG